MSMNRRHQTAKPRGAKKTFVRHDTAVPRGARYGSSDRRGNRIDVRDFN